MKHMNKILALVLALVMVLGLAINVSAANITIDDDVVEGAEYSAYKLLNATHDGGENYAYTVNAKYRDALQTVLSQDKDEDGTIEEEELLNDKEIIEAIAAMDDDAIRDFADAVYEQIKNLTADYVTDPESEDPNTLTDVDQGYYLIVETKTGSAEGFDEDTFSLVMLDTAGQVDITVETKEELPTSEKKVKDINDSTDKGMSDWQDAADHDIADEVPFQITFTLPGDFAEYKEYYVGIHDVQAEGLTFMEDTLKITINGKNVTDYFTYEAVKAEEPCAKGCTFHIQCADIIKEIGAKGIALNAGDTIVFNYSSVLNENAVFGATGNPNEMTIEFSNNPYGDGTSETPRDRVIVFTYKVKVDKYREKVQDGYELTGAGFTLYKEVQADSENALTGAEIKAGFAENIKADALDDTKYYIVACEVKTDKDGDTFGFNGVDDGNYVLVETQVPAGYNAWDAEAFTISAEHDEDDVDDPKLINLTGGDLFTGEVENIIKDGVLDTDIINNSGIELPSTGGIGTTIFYIVGGLLAVAAVILLVTKKRMSSAE